MDNSRLRRDQRNYLVSVSLSLKQVKERLWIDFWNCLIWRQETFTCLLWDFSEAQPWTTQYLDLYLEDLETSSQTKLTTFPSCLLGLLHHSLPVLVNGTTKHSATQARMLGAKSDSSKQSLYSVDHSLYVSLKYVHFCPSLLPHSSPGHHTFHLHCAGECHLTVFLVFSYLLSPLFSTT